MHGQKIITGFDPYDGPELPPNAVLEYVHKNDIRSGDTIMVNGRARTVCQKDITRDGFMGVCLFGSAYPDIVRVVYACEHS